MNRRSFLSYMIAGIAATAFAPLLPRRARSAALNLTDAEWQQRLTPAQYNILRHEGTEAPYSSPLNSEHRAGIFACAGCGQDLFDSKTKFDSGTGWPSFNQALPNAIALKKDASLFMERTEYHCTRCGGHHGHLFNDGPAPTGLRHCSNGAALTFKPAA